jgi:TolB protein
MSSCKRSGTGALRAAFTHKWRGGHIKVPRPSLSARGEGGPGAPGPGEGCFKQLINGELIGESNALRAAIMLVPLVLLPIAPVCSSTPRSISRSAVTGEPQRLTDDGVLKLAPVFVDGGRAVVFSVHDEPNRVSLVRLRLADGLRERVEPTLPAHQFDADVSADGRYLCYVLTYTSPQSILVLKDLKEGTESRFIPRDARGTVRGPRISPNGERVVFTLSDPGGQQIASVDMKAGDLTRLTESTGTNCWPAISPDGSRIAFCSSRNGSFQIYLMNADGSGVRQLTKQPLRDMRPAWSPDGKRIAFTSARDGNLEIYVIHADGTNLRRITNHPDRDDFPVWHPDGKRLLVVSERDGNSDLYMIDVEP